MKMTKSVKLAQCLHSSLMRPEVKASLIIITTTTKKLWYKKLPLTTVEIQQKAPKNFID